MTLLDTALKAGMKAGYVLFNFGFSTSHRSHSFKRHGCNSYDYGKQSDQVFVLWCLVDETADITCSCLRSILTDALMASFQKILTFNDEQLTAFTADFESRLPKHLRNALHPEATVA